MTAAPPRAGHGALDVPATIRGAVSHRGVVYAEPQGFRPLLMDVHVPAASDGPVPCVVWVHGGAWWEGDRRFLPSTWPPDSLFEILVEAGLAVATVDYRLSGEAVWPAQLDDVVAAWRFVRAHAAELGVDPERVAVAGESAGGHLAAMLALTAERADGVRAAAVLYGVTDLNGWTAEEVPADMDPLATPELLLMGVGRDEAPERWAAASPITHARAGVPPMLLITGDADSVVPARQTLRLHEALVAAGAADVVLDVVPGADHCFGAVDPIPVLRRIVGFLADRLTT